jgi:hypothetical protein
MLTEDILGFNNVFAVEERRHRALREARAHLATTSRIKSRLTTNHRGQRALRKTHPSAHGLHRRVLRAHHLSYNYFTRPQRRNLQTNYSEDTELLDGLYLKGGWDGSQIFIKLELDVSRKGVDDLRDAILKPLGLLSETDFLQDLNLNSGGPSGGSNFDGIDADISFSAGAHLGATGKYIIHTRNVVQMDFCLAHH